MLTYSQTPACQATDVKKHYFDCSPLAGPSSAYPIAPVELDAIVKHVSIPLLQWNNAVVYAQQRGQRVAPHSAGAKAICGKSRLASYGSRFYLISFV
jgi:hypothetical protein